MRWLFVVSSIFLTAALQCGQAADPFGAVVLSPCDFGDSIAGQQGLIVLPENRAKDDSQAIVVHFLLFPAVEPNGSAPLFFLPGGPGGFFDEAGIARLGRLSPDKYSSLTEIRRYNQHRDVLIINHRGNASAPGLQSKKLVWTTAPGRLDTMMTFAEVSRRHTAGAKAAFEKWQARGMDLAGYDILNMVEDIDDIRQALGYQRIALRGSSFGSQWAFAYMKQHPENVDRALLSAIEPLDHGWDSPQGVWNVLARVEQQVQEQGKLKLPEVGLLGAVTEIVQRLEAKPATVDGRHASRGSRAKIPIGADDFRNYLLSGYKGRSRMERGSRQSLPKFVVEVYQGDYRYLASQIMAYRDDPSRQTMIATLVDNSLGISQAREQKLRAQEAYRWLGDINWIYTATREVTPTPVVSDEFRTFAPSEIPVLMVHGDLDMSTPIENALEQIEYLPNGHLIRIEGGTHAAMRDVFEEQPEFLDHLVDFMEADFEVIEPTKVYGKLPNTVALSPLKFDPLDGPSLWDQVNRHWKGQ